MNYCGITYPDVNNFIGCRCTLWISGCLHHCPFCHNPQTWDFNYGKEFTEDTLNELIEALEKPYIKGLTLSGGDPLYSYDSGLIDILEAIRAKFRKTKDICLYTGFTLDTVKEKYPKILELVDYIIDGEYKHELRDITLPFRGSSNQTIWEKDNEGNFIVSKYN